MGKPTGFLEFARELPADSSPVDRLKHWDEFHAHHADDKLRQQASRCMDCGIPFCHTGTLISGMASGCPVNNLIPEWNDLIYRGLWREALERLHRTNNFPEFTGRVCPAPCEGSCTVGINAPPVTIKEIERSIIDRGFEQGWVTPDLPTHRTGRQVAVVGSGPAGLACAAQLNKAGHSVTVFERADRPGGLLMYGIPNMKLEKERVLLRRIRLMEQAGVRFVCGVEVGRDFPVEKLLKDFHAVVLCTGATKPRDLPVPGRELQGVHFAMEFLHGNTQALLDKAEPALSAKGRHVVVIGGGDTGTDCVGTSLRHGCASVTQVEILPKPPLTRQTDNPWPEWPKVLKVDYGQEEAAAIQGADPRVYLTTATKFEGDASGRVQAVHTVEVKWGKNDKGQFVPQPVPGTEKVLPAQLVLLAMGFLGPDQALPEQLGLERDGRSNIQSAHQVHTTNVRGIFVAGDCRRGQSLVVWAINEGRAAAREVDRFLMGRSDLP